MPVLRNEQGEVMAIVCGRGAKKCAYCDGKGTQLCDYEFAGGGTCDTPICGLHTWHPGGDLTVDMCRVHRRIIEGPERNAKRKAELAAKKRDTLIFIAQSKYAGRCKEKDCGGTWEKGDGMFWDSKTRETFCSECGELMQ